MSMTGSAKDTHWQAILGHQAGSIAHPSSRSHAGDDAASPRCDDRGWLLGELKTLTTPGADGLAALTAREAPALAARLACGGSVLDIGAAGCDALTDLARRFPAARIVGMALDGAGVATARRVIAEAALDGRVLVRHEDAAAEAEASAYDLATTSLAFHETGGVDGCRHLLQRVRRLLKPGGLLVASELRPSAKTAVQPLRLREALADCATITPVELRALLDGAGFVNLRMPGQTLPTCFIMLAERPA